MRGSNVLQERDKRTASTDRRRKENGEAEEVGSAELKGGDMIMGRPGEKVRYDETVIEGESHVNESLLTWGSRIVAKHKSDQVIGGSVNDKGTLKIKVKHIGKDSYLSKVIAMVKEAQETKSKTQNIADKAAAWLFYIALGAGITTLVVWLSLGKDF